jgi:hypothetical protein
MQIQRRRPLHPVLRALLRVMAAPDSALALALGGYAKTFVRWHLWGMVRQNLAPQGELVRSLGAEDRTPSAGPVVSTLGRLTAEMRKIVQEERVADLKLAPNGCLLCVTDLAHPYSEGGPCHVPSPDGAEGEWVQTSRPCWASVVYARGTGETGLNFIGHTNSMMIGFAAAWEAGMLFAAYVSNAYVLSDTQCRVWVMSGPLGRPDQPMRSRPVRGPYLFKRVARKSDFDPVYMAISCDRLGRRLYIMNELSSNSSRVVVADAAENTAVRAWTAPLASAMAVTDLEFVALAHAWPRPVDGRTAWVGVYTPDGKPLRRWELPTGYLVGLYSDSQTDELLLLMREETAVETSALRRAIIWTPLVLVYR